MAEHELLQLARDLEWLGCELEFQGHRHAVEGFPKAGPTWEGFLQKQEGVLRTADKIERELKNEVRFNPAALVGVGYQVDEALDSVTVLLAAVEDIKQIALFAVQDLPPRVRGFTRMIESHLNLDTAPRG